MINIMFKNKNVFATIIIDKKNRHKWTNQPKLYQDLFLIFISFIVSLQLSNAHFNLNQSYPSNIASFPFAY